MKLIICAMKSEIENILNKIHVKKIHDKYFEIYEYKKIIFVISGVGSLNSIACLTYMLNNYFISDIYNFGVAGSLSNKIPIFSVVSVKSVFWFVGEESIHKIHKINQLKQQKFLTIYENLLTSDFFVGKNFLSEIIPKFSKHPIILKKIAVPKITDMEFGALHYVAKKYKKNIYSIKIISDNINDYLNEQQYLKNMVYCKDIIKKIFFEIFIKEL